MAQGSSNYNIISPTMKIGGANVSAFGDLVTVENHPIFQGDFVYGINTQIWQTAVTSGTGATVDTNASRLRIQSGTTSNGYAYILSRKSIKYRAGQGVTARFTPLFTAGVANNVQLWGVGTIASNAPYDGYFIGYNGTTLSICRYASGSPNFVAQSSWNGDKLDGTGASGFNWNATLGTPFMIRYPYLGYGDIFFYIQNSATGEWINFHTIQYANTSATVQLVNPNLNFMGFTKNDGNTTNQIMYCGSVGVFGNGMHNYASNPKWAADGITGSITTETVVFSIRNATTYNGVTNRGQLRLSSITASGAVTGANPNSNIIVRLYLNSTIGGSPSFSPVSGSTADNGVTITSGNSVASKDVAGTLSSGTYVYNINVGANGNETQDLTDQDLFLEAGQILTVTATASNAAVVRVGLNWSEDI